MIVTDKATGNILESNDSFIISCWEAFSERYVPINPENGDGEEAYSDSTMPDSVNGANPESPKTSDTETHENQEPKQKSKKE